MERLKTYLEGLNPPPRSQLGKAKNYGLERWSKMTAFLDDGALDLDNNSIESRFKDLKLGMKNSLFIQSDRGGNALVGFLTLVVNCQRNGFNPYDYIADILRKIARGWPQSRLDELLPHNWDPSKAEGPLTTVSDYLEVGMTADELVDRLGIRDKVTIRSSVVDPPPPATSPPEHEPVLH